VSSRDVAEVGVPESPCYEIALLTLATWNSAVNLDGASSVCPSI
jgi:hypothetical protein